MSEIYVRPTSLETIPGMAKCGIEALNQAGIKKLSDLKDKDPVDLYIQKKDQVHSDRRVPLFNALMLGCVYATIDDMSKDETKKFDNLMNVPNMHDVAAYALLKAGFSLSEVGPANTMFEQAFKSSYLGPKDWLLVYYSVLILAGYSPEGEKPGPWIPIGTN